MDQKMLKQINMGACAYFLIVDSVLSFLLQTWFTSAQAGLFLAEASNLLMLAAGIFFWKKYRSAFPADSDGSDTAVDPDDLGATANSAAVMIGGSAIMIIAGQLLLRILLMQFGNGNGNLSIPGVLFLLMIAAFAAIGVLSLWKGPKGTKDQQHGAEIRFVCYRSALLFLLFRGVYYVLMWLQPFLTLQDLRIMFFDLHWNIMPLTSITAALILYFAPLKINTAIKSIDTQRDRLLAGWAQIIAGWLLLLTGIFDMVEWLIMDVMQIFSAFGGYETDSPASAIILSFAPALILILISLMLIRHGRKHTI